MVMNNESDSQLFRLEIALPSQPSATIPTGLRPRRGRWFLQVPATRLSQEIRQITRRGAKILGIKAISQLHTPIKLPWWLEILTDNPRCLYYFGPFDSAADAQDHQSGYVEDLQQEGAENISVQVKQCQPQIFTQEW